MISSINETRFDVKSERIPLIGRKPRPPENVLRKFALEPAVLLFYFGMFTAEMIVPNETLKLLCFQKFGNQSECNTIGTDNQKNNNETNHDFLQIEAARIFVLTSVFSKVIPAIATFFIMQWSDKFGRRPILILSFFGSSLSILLMLLNAKGGKFSSPWNYALAHIPNALVGASATKSTIIFSYIADISTTSEKSSRLLGAEITITIGTFLGTLAIGYLSKSTSAETVFLISFICVLVSCLWCIFFVDESLKVRTEERSITKFDQIRKLFSLEPVKEMKNTLFRKREWSERKILWSLILIQTLVLFVTDGERSIFYLFTMTKFKWTLKDFSMFNSTITLLVVAGNLSGIFIFKRFLKFSDSSILLLAVVFRVIDSSFKTFATSTSQMYIISSLCLLKALLAAMNRSNLSSFIPQNEIGKVFTILSFSETFGGFVAPAIYTSVYLRTLNYYPGAFYIMSTCFEVTIFFFTLFATKMLSERKMIMTSFNTKSLKLLLYKTTRV